MYSCTYIHIYIYIYIYISIYLYKPIHHTCYLTAPLLYPGAGTPVAVGRRGQVQSWHGGEIQTGTEREEGSERDAGTEWCGGQGGQGGE